MLPHPYYICNHVQGKPVVSVAERVERERGVLKEKNVLSERKKHTSREIKADKKIKAIDLKIYSRKGKTITGHNIKH